MRQGCRALLDRVRAGAGGSAPPSPGGEPAEEPPSLAFRRPGRALGGFVARAPRGDGRLAAARVPARRADALHGGLALGEEREDPRLGESVDGHHDGAERVHARVQRRVQDDAHGNRELRRSRRNRRAAPRGGGRQRRDGVLAEAQVVGEHEHVPRIVGGFAFAALEDAEQLLVLVAQLEVRAHRRRHALLIARRALVDRAAPERRQVVPGDVRLDAGAAALRGRVPAGRRPREVGRAERRAARLLRGGVLRRPRVRRLVARTRPRVVSFRVATRQPRRARRRGRHHASRRVRHAEGVGSLLAPRRVRVAGGVAPVAHAPSEVLEELGVHQARRGVRGAGALRARRADGRAIRGVAPPAFPGRLRLGDHGRQDRCGSRRARPFGGARGGRVACERRGGRAVSVRRFRGDAVRFRGSQPWTRRARRDGGGGGGV